MISRVLTWLLLFCAPPCFAQMTMMGVDNMQGPVLPQYLGQVATRSVLLNAVNTTQKQLMSRRWHFARDNITSLQVVIPNYFVDTIPANGGTGSGNETGSGGIATVTASVEYPVGTFTQIKFSGTASGTIASGSQRVSDATTVSIPNGAKFYIRVFYTNSTAIVFGEMTTNNYEDVSGGDATTFAPSGLSDQTIGGTVVDTNTSGIIYWSVSAIIAQTTHPAIGLFGDSRVIGATDLPDASGDMGELARSIGPTRAYINGGINTDRAMWIAVSGTNRAALFAYCSHLVTEYGFNDLNLGARTAAQIQANLATIWSAFPGKPKFHVTYDPGTTSTDAWATTGNQTTLTHDAVRLAMNAWTRGRPSPLNGYFDIASLTESGLNSGKWGAPGFTTDGIHPSNSEYVSIGSSGLINPSVFR
jgi:hypothetical protein